MAAIASFTQADTVKSPDKSAGLNAVNFTAALFMRLRSKALLPSLLTSTVWISDCGFAVSHGEPELVERHGVNVERRIVLHLVRGGDHLARARELNATLSYSVPCSGRAVTMYVSSFDSTVDPKASQAELSNLILENADVPRVLHRRNVRQRVNDNCNPMQKTKSRTQPPSGSFAYENVAYVAPGDATRCGR